MNKVEITSTKGSVLKLKNLSGANAFEVSKENYETVGDILVIDTLAGDKVQLKSK